MEVLVPLRPVVVPPVKSRDGGFGRGLSLVSSIGPPVEMNVLKICENEHVEKNNGYKSVEMNMLKICENEHVEN